MRKAMIFLLLSISLLVGCATSPVNEPVLATEVAVIIEETISPEIETIVMESISTPDPREVEIQAQISRMTTREKAAQLFVLALPAANKDAFVTEAQAGGYILFAQDITSIENTRALTAGLIAVSNIPPFIGIDEEGGVVSRLGAAGFAGYQKPASAASIGRTGDFDKAYESACIIGAALRDIGVNLDFAPVADVLTEPSNTAIGTRAYGDDAALVSGMVSAFCRGLSEYGVLSAPKHFPGHGGTTGDSHDGYVSIPYDAAHLASVEYVPFVRAIEEGASFIMAGHIAAPNADASGLPASLSPYFLTEVLRVDLGFEGIIITDAMNMGAIAANYTAAEAAVLAIQAGADMILMPEDYAAALDGLTEAVQSGAISMGRLEASVARVLRVKIGAGMWLPQE